MNPRDLTDTVLSIYQGRISNAHVRIEHRSRARRKVHCFDGEIRQVISNLVGNALDVMPSGGRLLVREREATNWRTGEPGVSITIADDASGMSPEVQARIWNPFFTTKGVTGTGLGLWVSKEIVQRHRGELNVRSSQSPAHHGTVFTLFLPFDAVVSLYLPRVTGRHSRTHLRSDFSLSPHPFPQDHPLTRNVTCRWTGGPTNARQSHTSTGDSDSPRSAPSKQQRSRLAVGCNGSTIIAAMAKRMRPLRMSLLAPYLARRPMQTKTGWTC